MRWGAASLWADLCNIGRAWRKEPVTDQPEEGALGASFAELGRDAEAYFDRAVATLAKTPRPDRWERPNRDLFWAQLPVELREEAGRLMQHRLG